MAFADPQTVTINTVAKTLPRTSVGANSSVYMKDDQEVKLTASHQYGKRTRRSIRLDFRKTAQDPLISSQNIIYTMSTYLVVDVPTTGFTVTEAKQIVDGLLAYLTASSGAQVTKLLGGEN